MIKFIDNYPLKTLTTLAIGGPAKKFVEVSIQEELIEAIKYAQKENLKFLVIGGGSNLLISDQGVDYLVIKNYTWEVGLDSSQVCVASGTPLQELVNYSIKNGLSGLEKLSGIPGTVGGAIFGNAGAYGQSISDHITEITAYDGENIVTLSKDKCTFDYRDSIFKKNKFIILSAKFQLEKDDKKTLQKEADEVLRRRHMKYPQGIKCPGSFFKNLIASEVSKDLLKQIPAEIIIFDKIPAAFLLAEVGAKGQKLHGIEIAPYHANLFINTGEGTAKDFYNLAKEMQDKVKEKFGITLVPEVQLINLPPLS